MNDEHTSRLAMQAGNPERTCPESPPTVSIVTPCYNGARFLSEAVQSALDQSRLPIEVIVVDDGSTDESASVAESFGPPVRVIRQENRGESAARNRGIREARGDYVLFLDADDKLYPPALEKLTDAVRGRPGAVALMGAAYVIEGSDTPYHTRLPTVDSFFPHIIDNNLGSPHSYLTQRDLLLRLGGFRESLQYFEDWDLWCQVGLTGAQLVPVPFVGAYFRRHPDSQSYVADPVNRRRGHVAVIERLIAGMLRNPDLLQAHGERAFWAGWAALHRARQAGVPWTELRELADRLEHVARVGPGRLRRSRFVRLAGWWGIRPAETLRSWFVRDRVDPADDGLRREMELRARLTAMKNARTGPS